VRAAAGTLLLVVVLAGCSGGDSETNVHRVADPLPVLEGDSVDDGTPMSTDDHAGEVLVLNVWASWCEPCEAEMPELVRAANAYAGRGVTFLGINHQDQRAAARAFAERYDVPYDSFHDDAGRFAAELGYLGLPDTYVVDRTGTIRFTITGATTEAQLSGLLDELLAAEGSA
jgi:thiol-disulfide isomerase/thioredoxin